ncbi:hypothetical protein OIU79_002943 [Salix purpurea]|uniref:Uncharacterized protein n=1 Tax=Salix purpurea TaxID=77065 RepID=A0A9Q0ZEM1_SALPP|nr:hypothetical protein OIU79_002943 [Salix purpurea]
MAVYNWESKKIYLFLSSTRSYDRDLRQHKPRHDRRDGKDLPLRHPLLRRSSLTCVVKECNFWLKGQKVKK